MAKLIDYIAVRLVAFAALFIILHSVFGKFVLSVILSALIVAAGSVVYGKFFAAKIKREHISAENLFKFFLTNGNAFAAEYICKNIKAEYNAALEGDFISFKSGGADGLIFPVFKYSKVSKDEVLKIYRIAKERGAKKVLLITKNFDRDVFLAAEDLNFPLSVIKIPVLHRYLKSLRALPPPPRKVQRNKKDLPGLKLALDGVLSAKNGRRFLFATLILLIASVLTPLKTYYYTMSSISFALAVLCAAVPSKQTARAEIFTVEKSTKKTNKNDTK
ncbi:MAG: hypothetical protein LBP62_06275 [Clostridiales bacterium]|jgi:hypothetical protein|nr:hypothetical protein [Clostridiales bacterium]